MIFAKFLAPEIFLRLSPGYSSDFYSVGLILYQMMVGHVKIKKYENYYIFLILIASIS